MLPVAGEPLGEPVRLRRRPRSSSTSARARATTSRTPALDALRAAGHPVFTLQLDGGPADLGALFVEWEVATALVGARLHINPFDQPNVQEAKDRTVAILEGFARDGKLPAEEPGLAERRARARRARPLLRLPAGVRGPHARAPGAARAPAGPPARRARLRRHGRLRPALPALDRASTTRAGRRPACSCSCWRASRTTRRSPGAPFGFRTLRDAQALGDAGALRGRGLPVARIPLAACEAAIERALEHIANTRIST